MGGTMAKQARRVNGMKLFGKIVIIKNAGSSSPSFQKQ
jgi:hypothetical protein